MAEQLPRQGGIVIIGGGECGAHTAFALRERGWAGPVTVIGDEPVHAYERPPLSKASMMSEQRQPVHPYPAGAFADAGIRTLTSTRVDRILPAGRTIQIAGHLLGYDRLLLAVGASPRRLPLPHDNGLLYLRTVQDARTIRATLGPGRHARKTDTDRRTRSLLNQLLALHSDSDITITAAALPASVEHRKRGSGRT